MLYLSDAEVTRLIDGNTDRVVELMREMFLLVNKGDYVLGGSNGASHGMRITRGEGNEQRIFIAMPGYLGGRFNMAGVKWHGPSNPFFGRDSDSQYTVILSEPNTGEPKAIMRANTLTNYRTAAVNFLAVEQLTRPNPQVLSIIGPGKINRIFTLQVMDKFRSIKTIKIKGRGEKSRERFIDSVRTDFPSVETIRCETVKDAVLDADIVSINAGLFFNSYADMPRIRSQWIKPGSLFICSAYASFPDALLIGNSVKVCDMYKAYEAYEEELGYPASRSYGVIGNRFTDLVIEKKLRREDMIDLAEVLTGEHNVVDDDPRPILFSNSGIVLEDIALACAVYERARAQHVGLEVE